MQGTYCADEMGSLPGLWYLRVIDELNIYTKNMDKKNNKNIKYLFTVQNYTNKSVKHIRFYKKVNQFILHCSSLSVNDNYKFLIDQDERRWNSKYMFNYKISFKMND